MLIASGGLLLLALFLVSASTRAPDRPDPLARLLLDGLYPLQSSIATTRLGAKALWNGYIDLVEVRRENESLRRRITDLERQVVRTGELEATTHRLEQLLGFREAVEGRSFGARVIGRDPLPWSRTLTLDRGSRDGVRRGMAVVAPTGVVGQTQNVGRMASRVLLLTDQNSGIDAVVQRSRARGIVQGALQEGCHMKYLRRGEDVQIGDIVITSGLDGIFPRGIPIGKIVEVSKRHRGLLQVAVVAPSVDLERTEEVLVVELPLSSTAETAPMTEAGILGQGGPEGTTGLADDLQSEMEYR